MIDYPKLNRLEIIDHRKCSGCNGIGFIMNNKDNGRGIPCANCNTLGTQGRSVIVAGAAYKQPDNAAVSMEFQDDDRTLKIFIKDKDDNQS